MQPKSLLPGCVLTLSKYLKGKTISLGLLKDLDGMGSTGSQEEGAGGIMEKAYLLDSKR